MKESEIVEITFDPLFKRIGITRCSICSHPNKRPVKRWRAYSLTPRWVEALWYYAGSWDWKQENGVTTLTRFPK